MLQHTDGLTLGEHMGGCDLSRTAEGLWAGSLNPPVEQIW